METTTPSHSPPLTSRAKGHAPPECMLNSLICSHDRVHAPLEHKQSLQKDVLKEENDSIHTSQMTFIINDSYIHPSPNKMGIYQI